MAYETKCTLDEMKAAHKLLAKYDYELGKVDRGYTNRTLYVDLSQNQIKSKPVSEEMKEIFIGGRGFGLKLLWDAVKDDTKWDDPENEIIISTGPLGGTTQYPGCGKSLVVSISPLTGGIADSNVGGYFGPLLKFAGWDALEIQGKAEKDVIIFIDGNKGTVTIEEAPLEAINSHILAEQLTEMYADSEADKRNVSVVSSGQGAEHSFFGMLNFSFYDVRRKVTRLKQAGRGGIGRVFRDKKIKALVVKFAGVKGNSNGAVDIGRIAKAGLKINRELRDLDQVQCRMRTVGTGHISEIANDYDFLPCYNYRFGAHPEAKKIHSFVWEKLFTQGIPDGCWYGCTMSCAKAVENFQLYTGPYRGETVIVDGPEYETLSCCGSSPGIWDPHAIIEINFYVDTYGLDAISFGTSMAFVMECYELGLIDKEITGGLELKFGNALGALEVLHQIARGEGFGLIFGQGIRRMKKIFAERCGADPQLLEDIGMESKGMEYSGYVTKDSIAQQGGYGMTLKGAQHDEAWLIFMDKVNKQIPTWETKAQALWFFPLFRTWFGLNGLCKLPWNDVEPADNAQTAEPAKVPEHLQNYLDVFSATTGKEVTEDDIIRMSEGMYNFQRLFNLRLGYGTREHDRIPYRSQGPVLELEYESRKERYDKQLKEEVGFDPEGKSTQEKMAALRKFKEKEYQLLMDATYARRGWTPNGFPTLETVKRLRIDFPDVVELIKKHMA